MKRRITVEFPHETPSWESWCNTYDFHQLCDELGLIIIEELDVE